MNKFREFQKVYSDDTEKLIEEAFPNLKDECYLDHAGASLYTQDQIRSVCEDLSNNLYGNPHTTNISSKVTNDSIDVIRLRILEHFRTTPDEYSVIFTSGATASLKLVAECFNYGSHTDHGVFAYLEDNHTSVLGMRTYSRKVRPVSRFAAIETLSNTNSLDNKKSLSHSRDDKKNNSQESNSLFVYPAQCNFSGVKYPLSWIKKVKKGALDNLLSTESKSWYVLLDAAAYVSTNNLDLSEYEPDFVAISFYKMFGYPTGLGALLVKNSSRDVLVKKYYGGGTVFLAVASENVHIPRESFHERFEDGTVSFLSIISLRHGFEALSRLKLNYSIISQHTFYLSQYLYRNLRIMHHNNGKPVAVVYSDTDYETVETQGAVIAFNILRADGSYIGYSEVLHAANLYNIRLRTGCFCNPGACQRHLGLTVEDVYKHFEAGHVCGDQHDLVDGYPTGCVRVSFGYMTTKDNVDKFLAMIRECFMEKPVIIKVPSDYFHKKIIEKRKSEVKKQLEASDVNNNGVTNGILRNIFVYPVKSCAAFKVMEQWELCPTGLKYDRQWMIVNSANVCLTQKMHKGMCLIQPNIDSENNLLTLSTEGFKDVSIPLDENSGNEISAKLFRSKVCNKNVRVYDCGDEVAKWIDNVLNMQGCRLLKQRPTKCDSNINNPPNGKKSEHNMSLANEGQYLLINTASVRWLQQKMLAGGLEEELDSTVRRFRPNFVVDFKETFVENSAKYFFLGEGNTHHCFTVTGKCTRCQMICINQVNGKASKQPLITLSKEKQGDISFGVYLSKETILGTPIKIGTSVKMVLQ